MKTPRGFSFAGMHSGIKQARRDLGLVACEVPCAAAGIFTINRARAAFVHDAAPRLPTHGISAIVVNSGNANALTGPDGIEAVRQIQEAAAAALGVDRQSVLCASTGVIGVPLPTRKIVAAIPALVRARGPNVESAAEAILTTDTRVKLASRTVTIDGAAVTVAGFAKGSGMIAPELATLLAFITTDARVEPEVLQESLRAANETSFSCLNVDGEMSTNDAVFALASGLAQERAITLGSAAHAAFLGALRAVCTELARAVAEDGEGATRLLEVHVRGALTEAVARDLARAVAGSILVRASVFGTDPNWGRVVAALGARAGVRGYPLDIDAMTVRMQGVAVFEHGKPASGELASLRARLRAPEVLIEADLEAGDAEAIAWGSDLSYDYVKINADYMAFTRSSPEGTVARDDRFTNYGPTFKRMLLVEALSYVERFAKKRAVVRIGGTALGREGLRASVAGDVNLLRSAGMRPIVVHGGAAELDALGAASSQSKGARALLAAGLNTELVSLLNQQNARAVGLSGTDAGLLRAKRAPQSGAAYGEIISVTEDLVDVLVSRDYVPVLSPVGVGEDGEAVELSPDLVAAEVAIALKAEKLLFVVDAPGILDGGELVGELRVSELRVRLERGDVPPQVACAARGVLRAFEGGVLRAHIIDGRVPHTLIGELFTDRGVGTLIVAD